MSFGGLKTKKVTTYGRKKTQIISVRSDFSLTRIPAPPKTPPLPIDLTSDTSSSRSPSPIAVRPRSRPPLTNKTSQNIIIPTTTKPIRGAKEKAKGKYIESPPSSPESPVLLKRPKTYGRQRVVPRSPSFVPSSPEKDNDDDDNDHDDDVMTPRKCKAVMDCIEIVSSVQRVRPARSRRQNVVKLKSKSKAQEEVLQRFARITIESSPTPEEVPAPTPQTVSTDEVLAECSSHTVHPFSDFLSSSTLLGLIHTTGTGPPPKLRCQKVGEATYSEVYGLSRGGDEIIVKIIPLSGSGHDNFTGATDLPDCSTAQDILREISITQRLSGLKGGGFVDFLGAFLVQGRYPNALLDKWDTYKIKYGSQSIRPDVFEEDQQYALVVLSDGGDDLETFAFDPASGWKQAASVFWQIVATLAKAEEAVSFEHRDLHEGQILISEVPVRKGDKDVLSPFSAGVKATIIDFGLSRLDSPSFSASTFTPLPEEVYDGLGAQWDVYRSMRDEVGDNWEAFHPVTNLMWINYILGYMIRSKSLRKPHPQSHLAKSARLAGNASSPLRAAKRVPLVQRKTKSEEKKDPKYRQDAVSMAYEMLVEMESELGDALKAGNKSRGRRLGSAGDVLRLGKEKGWLR